MILDRKGTTRTKNYPKLKAFCLSAILIISFLIEDNGVVSMHSCDVAMDEGKNTTPKTLKLFGVTIETSGPNTPPERITNTGSTTSPCAALLLNRVQDSNEFFNVEIAPQKNTERFEEGQGPVQEVGLKIIKRRRTTKTGRSEGTSAQENAEFLRKAPQKNHQTQTSPSNSVQGNLDNSESIDHDKGLDHARSFIKSLIEVGRHYESRWPLVKEKVRTWVSNVAKKLEQNSLGEVTEEGLSQKKTEGVLTSLENFIRSFLGLIVAWNHYEGAQVDSTILGKSWDCEKAYLESLLEEQEKPEKKENNNSKDSVEASDVLISSQQYMDLSSGRRLGIYGRASYNLWCLWLDNNREIKKKLSLKHFNTFLKIIRDFGTEGMKSSERILEESQGAAQALPSSEANLIAGRVEEKDEIPDYKEFLVEKGTKLVEILNTASENIQQKLTKMRVEIGIKGKPSQDSTMSEGTKCNPRSRRKGKKHCGKSSGPLFATGRAQDNLISRVLPGFFGWVEDLNRQFGKEEERAKVLKDCLDYVLKLISQWDEIDLIELINRKTGRAQKINENQTIVDPISEGLFSWGAFYKTGKNFPANFMVELLRGWVNTNNSQAYKLGGYLAKHEKDLNPKFFSQFEAVYELACIVPNRLPPKGPNNPHSVRIGDSQSVRGLSGPA